MSSQTILLSFCENLSSGFVKIRSAYVLMELFKTFLDGFSKIICNVLAAVLLYSKSRANLPLINICFKKMFQENILFKWHLPSILRTLKQLVIWKYFSKWKRYLIPTFLENFSSCEHNLETQLEKEKINSPCLNSQTSFWCYYRILEKNIFCRITKTLRRVCKISLTYFLLVLALKEKCKSNCY